MLKRVLVHKAREEKKIGRRDLKRSLTSFALSMGLLFMGSSGAIFAKGESQDQGREAHKRRPEKGRKARKRRLENRREARKRGLKKSLSSSPGKRREALKRGLGNGLSGSPEKGREALKTGLGNNLISSR